MDKKRLTKILAKAEEYDVAALSNRIQKMYPPVIIKEPTKALTMIKMREPVKQSLFYIGEVIVCEATVEIDGTKGFAVLMGDNGEKVLDMAIIDAAVNKGVFTQTDTLLQLEKQQGEREMRENALHMKTMVNFESMDQEVPDDVGTFKKA